MDGNEGFKINLRARKCISIFKNRMRIEGENGWPSRELRMGAKDRDGSSRLNPSHMKNSSILMWTLLKCVEDIGPCRMNNFISCRLLEDANLDLL